ncbi:MAG TPA: hypothetical protein VJ895_01315 [Candidatus Nanoarchaeia archaeon]|nr:hypothetical protein [Candidatus Nanoarchaeia archaeon]
MNKYEKLANNMIEKISEIVEEKYNVKPKNITDDEIENPSLINGSIYYDLESEFAEKIEKISEDREDGFFKIPSMVISRDDLISRFEGSGDFEEKQKEITEISDDDMQFMAEKMTDMLMDDYWLALDEAYNSLLYWQEKERKKEDEL